MKIFVPVHGAVFVGYVVVALLVRGAVRWTTSTFVVALVARAHLVEPVRRLDVAQPGRAVEWGHKEIELAAHELLQYLDESRGFWCDLTPVEDMAQLRAGLGAEDVL